MSRSGVGSNHAGVVVALEILVIGAGVVGCATALVLKEGGHGVSAYDLDPSASSRFPGPVLSRSECLRPWPLVIIAVPTPTTDGRMDPHPLQSALDLVSEIPSSGKPPTTVAIRSTLVPGTMDGLVAEWLASRPPGTLHTLYWPCFARERSAVEDERSPRHTVIGSRETDARAMTLLPAVIAHIPGPVSVVRPVEAEFIKHGANLFNSLKISYFNALADWASEFGGDGQPVATLVAALAEGAWNPLYGTTVGPAFGGACLDKDLQALSAELTANGKSHLSLFDAIRDVNSDPRRAPAGPLPPAQP